MRWAAVVPISLLVAGALVLADSVRRGEANFALVFVIPVVSGQSLEFLLGAVVFVLGFFLLPLALFGGRAEEPSSTGGGAPPAGEPRTSSGAGGLILIGPIPIFFGRWSDVSRRTRWLVALVGVGLLAVFVVGFLVALH